MSENKSNQPKKQEKSYYEELQEKMREIDYSNYQLHPSGANGFLAKERKFGYILCALFLGILVLFYSFAWLNYLTRDKELTNENYREYFTIEVYPSENVNWTSYNVAIVPKKNMYTISDFSIRIEISFKKMAFNYIYEREVELFSETFTKNDVLEKTVSVDETGLIKTNVQVLAVSGGM